MGIFAVLLTTRELMIPKVPSIAQPAGGASYQLKVLAKPTYVPCCNFESTQTSTNTRLFSEIEQISINNAVPTVEVLVVHMFPPIISNERYLRQPAPIKTDDVQGIAQTVFRFGGGQR